MISSDPLIIQAIIYSHYKIIWGKSGSDLGSSPTSDYGVAAYDAENQALISQ